MFEQMFELETDFFKVVSVALRQFPYYVDLELLLPAVIYLGIILSGE